MANTLKFGNGQWATKEGSTLAYNSENGNFKPLPFDFTRASSATRVNKQGLIETVASGVPRIDFTDANGALKLEPQRTNLVTQSETFSGWSAIGSKSQITINDAISPDGTQNAAKLEQILVTDDAAIRFTGLTVGVEYTFSLYAKKGNFDKMQLDISDASVVLLTLTDDWVRYETTGTATGNFADISVRLGAIGSYFYIWGAQIEQGSYATSYIPTQGSAVTRIADACNNAGNDQVINSTEGVLYSEISALRKTNDNVQFIAIGGSVNYTNNSIYIQLRNGLNQLAIWAYSGGVNQLAQLITLTDITSFNKIAIKCKLNDFDVFINGVSVYSLNTYTPPTGLNVLSFDRDGSSPIFCNTKDLRVYNTALTDAELIALTT